MNNERLIQYGCAFEIRCGQAQQVKLVLERRPGKSRIYSLRPCGDEIWKTALELEPGEYRYCFHAYDGRSLTYLLPGDALLDGPKAVIHVGYDPSAINATSNQERTAHDSYSHRRNSRLNGWCDPLRRWAQCL